MTAAEPLRSTAEYCRVCKAGPGEYCDAGCPACAVCAAYDASLVASGEDRP